MPCSYAVLKQHRGCPPPRCRTEGWINSSQEKHPYTWRLETLLRDRLAPKGVSVQVTNGGEGRRKLLAGEFDSAAGPVARFDKGCGKGRGPALAGKALMRAQCVRRCERAFVQACAAPSRARSSLPRPPRRRRQRGRAGPPERRVPRGPQGGARRGQAFPLRRLPGWHQRHPAAVSMTKIHDRPRAAPCCAAMHFV